MGTTSNRHQVANKKDQQLSEATVYLYEEIGFWGISAGDFVKEFSAIDADLIHLRVNSPGGDVFAARAMHTAVKQHKAKVIAHIDGLAASAASFLAMAADEVEIVNGGSMMIHSAMCFMDVLGYFNVGDLSDLAEEIGKEITRMDKVDDSIASDYAQKCGKSVEEMKKMMTAETWLSAQEAVACGLADRVYDGAPVANNFDLTIFMNVPEGLRAGPQNVSKRAIERALRDAGCTQNMAKAILANGWKDGDQRDVEPTQPAVNHGDDQRDADNHMAPTKKDKTADLLIRAEMLAPSTIN